MRLSEVILLAAVGALFFYVWKKFHDFEERQKGDKTALFMNDLTRRLDSNMKTLGDVEKELRTMQEIGKNIDDLRLAFSSSKLRGNFGEKVLGDMLENSFPKDLFELQHKFKDGQIVDAIIRTKDGLICIDSKFPIEGYRKMVAATTEDARSFERNELFKAVRKHINDISKKYILPEQGTLEFAIMYVPSEAVFYEIISSTDELTALAERQRVMMTSPNTMSYFLHLLRLGQERMRIEENVQKVWGLLSGLQQDFNKFGDALRVAWGHVTNAKKTIDGVGNDFTKLAERIEQIKQLK